METNVSLYLKQVYVQDNLEIRDTSRIYLKRDLNTGKFYILRDGWQIYM